MDLSHLLNVLVFVRDVVELIKTKKNDKTNSYY